MKARFVTWAGSIKTWPILLALKARLLTLAGGIKTRLILLALVPLLLAVTVLWWVRYLWSVAFSPPRAWKLAISQDQNGNSALNGDEDKTISHRAALARRAGRRWGCVLCRVLDAIDPNHCDKSVGT